MCKYILIKTYLKVLCILKLGSGKYLYVVMSDYFVCCIYCLSLYNNNNYYYIYLSVEKKQRNTCGGKKSWKNKQKVSLKPPMDQISNHLTIWQKLVVCEG